MIKVLGISCLLIVSAGFISCNKDKVPDQVIDPLCTDTISFSQQIAPLISSNCVVCHDSGNTTGYTLTNHTNISANSNAILDAMTGQNGKLLMPEGGPALHDTLIQQFSCWIDQGMPNN